MKSNDNVDTCSSPRERINDFIDNVNKELKVIRDQTYGDILIFGSICRALCRTSTSIAELAKNKNLADQLIKEASKLYENYFNNYEFNLDRANALLNVSYSIASISNSKSFVLLGRAGDKTVACKAIVQIRHSEVSIIGEEFTEHSISIPNIILNIDDDSILDIFYDALVWILLTKEGFYLDSDGYFNRFTPPSTYNLTPKSFYNHTIFDPYHTIEIFTDKQ